jgi:hypothetical protein
MNLSALVGGVIGAVNPKVEAQYRASTGSTSAPSGRRTPTYADPVSVLVQKQALTYKDLQQLQGVNLNGEACAIYVEGDWRGVSRPAGRGGDLLTLPDGTVWLVVHVLENFFQTAGWAKVAAVLQNGQ